MVNDRNVSFVDESIGQIDVGHGKQEQTGTFETTHERNRSVHSRRIFEERRDDEFHSIAADRSEEHRERVEQRTSVRLDGTFGETVDQIEKLFPRATDVVGLRIRVVGPRRRSAETLSKSFVGQKSRLSTRGLVLLDLSLRRTIDGLSSARPQISFAFGIDRKIAAVSLRHLVELRHADLLQTLALSNSLRKRSTVVSRSNGQIVEHRTVDDGRTAEKLFGDDGNGTEKC